MEEVVRYTYRLRPGSKASQYLMAEWHRCRFLWNEAVAMQRRGDRPTFVKLSRLLTEARTRNGWLRGGSQMAQQQSLRTYAQALDESFRVPSRGRPTVKRRARTLPSLSYTARGFSIAEGYLRLPKGVTIPVVWSRELPSTPTSLQVFCDSLGHWYASFVVRREVESSPPAGGAIGIDWGIKTPATTTDVDYDLRYAGFRRRSASELAKAQRKQSRRRRPRGHVASKGYRQASRDVAKLHKRAARQATHERRVWAKRVVADHQLIAVEDLRLKFLAKTTMARKAADIGLGDLRRELVERAVRAGRRVVTVAPAYTTMTCSRCFARAKQRLGLGERTFSCHVCGYTAGRDENAARTILAVAERGGTSVDDVRHSLTSLAAVAGVQSELGTSA